MTTAAQALEALEKLRAMTSFGGSPTEIATLRQHIESTAAELEAMRGLLQVVVKEMDENKPDAPGHCHSVPGVWDDDNGARAGTKCEWCATWQQVRVAAELGRRG